MEFEGVWAVGPLGRDFVLDRYGVFEVHEVWLLGGKSVNSIEGFIMQPAEFDGGSIARSRRDTRVTVGFVIPSTVRSLFMRLEKRRMPSNSLLCCDAMKGKAMGSDLETMH